jgi:hypothetical protein
VIAGSCTVAGQVAEVRTSLAAVAPWLWLTKIVKLAELARIGLAWTGLAQTELARAEFVQTELV